MTEKFIYLLETRKTVGAYQFYGAYRTRRSAFEAMEAFKENNGFYQDGLQVCEYTEINKILGAVEYAYKGNSTHYNLTIRLRKVLLQ